MFVRVSVLVALLVSISLVAHAGQVEQLRAKRERQKMQQLLNSLLKSHPPKEVEFHEAAAAPQRCEDIEIYLQLQTKKPAEVQTLALIVEAHDAKLVSTRIYRARYITRGSAAATADFLMQQHGSAEWKVLVHQVAPGGADF